MNTRALATEILVEVIENGRSLSDALASAMPLKSTSAKNKISSLDRSFIQALCYGVSRWYFQLDTIATQLLQKPMKDKDQDIYILILVGLYQLIHMRIPDYAAVGETVSAAKIFKKIWAKNLVNGVLRQYQRSAAKMNEIVQEDVVAFYSHPEWMVEKLKINWPEKWEDILEANNQHPPFSLRINQQRYTREKYCDLFPVEIGKHIIPETKSGIVLENPVDVTELPEFATGAISVQDGAAQLAAELLMLKPGQRVLDACAAPGGKTAHILESQADLAELIAVDCDELRLDVVRNNLERLNLSAECIVGDIGELDSWWDNKMFDRILLDAPCSASGVIRRHPDIKLLRRESDLIQLAEEQTRLLASAWQTLKPGGILVYATCSIFSEENDQILKSFLETHSDAKEEKIQAAWGQEREIGRQILPGMHGMDGFYYARLKKY